MPMPGKFRGISEDAGLDLLLASGALAAQPRRGRSVVSGVVLTLVGLVAGLVVVALVLWLLGFAATLALAVLHAKAESGG